MSTALYDKLKKVEPRVAEAYKAAVTGKDIDLPTLQAIMRPVIDSKGPKGEDISPEEAEAIVLIIESGELQPGIKERLLKQLLTDKGMEKVLNGTGVELKPNDPELASFYGVFAIKYTGNVKFYSKGTNLTYSPQQYQAIAQLVKNGKITVVKVMDRGLLAKTGADCMYVAPSNMFFFFQHPGEKDYFSHAPSIVHEATHAVQDWFDVPSSVTTRYVEADAYIVEAMVDPTAPMHKKIKTAMDFVRDGTATKGNEAWYDAYEKVAELIDKDPRYVDRAQDPVKMDEGTGERAEFEKVIKALQKTAGGAAAPASGNSPPAKK
jgi:hypothetical protein